MLTRNAEEGIRGYRVVVDGYFERHAEQRGGKLHRRAVVLFYLFAAVHFATTFVAIGLRSATSDELSYSTPSRLLPRSPVMARCH
jgi:hypothetical protein